MARTTKEITYKYEARTNASKSDAYVVDAIVNKVRYKYTYSTTKYGDEIAKELGSTTEEAITATTVWKQMVSIWKS